MNFNKLLKNRLFVPALFSILLLAAFLLRSYMFVNGDFFYLVDQARDLLLAKGIAVDHDLTLIGGRTGFGGLFHGVLWIYFIVPLFLLSGGNPFFTLVPLFILVNLGIIVAGFMVGWKLYNKWMGLLFAFFLTISAELIVATQTTTNAQVMPLVFLLYLFSIVKFIRGNEKYIVLALFSIGLGIQFESAFSVLLFPLTIMAVLIRRKVPHLKYIFSGLILSLLAVSTFILFDLRNQFIMTNSAIRLLTNTHKPLPGYEEYAQVSYRVGDRINALWSSIFSPLYENNFLVGLLLIIMLISAVIFLVKRINSSDKGKFDKEFLFLILSPVVIFGLYIIYPFPLWAHYLIPLVILYSLIISVSILQLWGRTPFRLLALAFLLFVSIPPLNYLNNQYLNNERYNSVSNGSYINQKEVAEWVINDSKEKKAGFFVYSPGILTYNMDYLLWYFAKEKNVIKLENVKSPNTYLIMYPPHQGDEGGHVFWKENVIRTNAEPLTVKKFDSGIIVEKIDLSDDQQEADPNYFQNLIFR
jgi:4-amino-4-deoxy-L-arabinose transferase-like glycosyltransferase